MLFRSQSHSSTNIAQNSLKSSAQLKVKVKDSPTEFGMEQAESHSRSLTRDESINEYSSGQGANGVMGVPISFLDKFSPEQFEIIGCSDNGMVGEGIKLPHFKRHNEPYINGNKVYKRIFIKHKELR